jgi:hypothetical protein
MALNGAPSPEASAARITDRRETDGIPAGWSVFCSRFSNGMLIDASVAQP